MVTPSRTDFTTSGYTFTSTVGGLTCPASQATYYYSYYSKLFTPRAAAKTQQSEETKDEDIRAVHAILQLPLGSRGYITFCLSDPNISLPYSDSTSTCPRQKTGFCFKKGDERYEGRRHRDDKSATMTEKEKETKIHLSNNYNKPQTYRKHTPEAFAT